MRREGSTPEEYLSGLESWHLDKTTRLRELILESAPDLTENVRGGILYYEDEGDVLALAAQKQYVALYVLVPDVMDARRELLEGLDCGKGCIRFKARTEIPEQAISQLLAAAAAAPTRDCGKG